MGRRGREGGGLRKREERRESGREGRRGGRRGSQSDRGGWGFNITDTSRIGDCFLVGRLQLRQPVRQRQNKMDSERRMFQPPLCRQDIPELFSGQLVSQLESLNALD